MSYLYVKFMNYKRIGSFMSGNIFFSKLDTFNNKNDKADKRKINDSNEGAALLRLSNKNDTFTLKVNDYDLRKHLVDNRDGFSIEIIFKDAALDDIGIFCTTELNTEDKTIFRKNPQKIILLPSSNRIEIVNEYVLKKNVLKRLDALVGGENRIPVFIKPEFFSALRKKSTSNNVNIMYRPVEYYDKKTKRNYSPKASKQKLLEEVLFKKSDFYKKEMEHRVAINIPSNSKSQILKIGNISKFIDCFNTKYPNISYDEYKIINVADIRNKSINKNMINYCWRNIELIRYNI